MSSSISIKLRASLIKLSASLISLAAGMALCMPAAEAQSPHVNPGQALFDKSCAACHGSNAQGGRGPNLTLGPWVHGDSDRDITRNIINGIPGTQMPAFPMGERDAQSIVGYLRSLEKVTPGSHVAGDAEAGRAAFFGDAHCSQCHAFHGEGRRIGPNLSIVGRRTVTHPPVRMISKPVQGIVKFEDTFELQVIDDRERLHLLARADLKGTPPVDVPIAPITPDIRAFLQTAPAAQPVAAPSGFDVSFGRLQNAAAEPQNWMTYWGDLRGTHYSPLASVTPSNAGKLHAAWTHQFSGGTIETVPIVVDGVMFVTGPGSDAEALDARTGVPIWRYQRPLPDVHKQCTVMTNRGVAVLGGLLYLATLDAHLVALDARTGSVVWDVPVEDYRKGFSITHAPLAIDGKIVIGVTAGECALSGFVDAYDAATGKRLWRTRSIAQPGDPARSTWPSDVSADTGGGPTWMTGTYDADTRTVFWTIGNPGPDYDGSVRPGDNLYTNCVLALDEATGKIKWYFQFTPHDTHDWDANETPVLIDANFHGKARKLLIQANRNAFHYVLDRNTGEFLFGAPFSHQTWARGLDAKGRPIMLPNTDPTPEGNYICPDAQGPTNFAAPSYSPLTGLFYLAVRETCALYTSETKIPQPGESYVGTGANEDRRIGIPGAVRAIDPFTARTIWNFPLYRGSPSAGVLATAGGVVFAGSREGYLIALNAKTGAELWHFQTGAEVRSSPMSYGVAGKQYVAISNNSGVLVFALD